MSQYQSHDSLLGSFLSRLIYLWCYIGYGTLTYLFVKNIPHFSSLINLKKEDMVSIISAEGEFSFLPSKLQAPK